MVALRGALTCQSCGCDSRRLVLVRDVVTVARGTRDAERTERRRWLCPECAERERGFAPDTLLEVLT